MNDETPERLLAGFASDIGADTIPEEARRSVRFALADFGLCIRAGLLADEGTSLCKAGSSLWKSGECTAVGTATGLQAPWAAWHNSVLGHLLDADDNHDTLGGHPSAVLAPAVIAATEQLGRSEIGEAIDAYIVGCEVACRIARAMGRAQYGRGWHSTALVGVFGATAAASRLRGLKADELACAFGLAAGMASGLKVNFGSVGKSVQVGHASAMGVLAAALVGEGLHGSPVGLSGHQGLADALAVEQPDWGALAGLGADWAVIEPGIAYKPYPCCASLHGVIEATGALRQRLQDAGDPPIDQVRRARLELAPGRIGHVDRVAPGSGAEARFSLQYSFARTWQHGDIGAFTEAEVSDPAVRVLAKRVEVKGSEDEAWPWTASTVAVEFMDGRIETAHVDVPRGHGRARPPVSADLRDKACMLGLGTETGDAAMAVAEGEDASLSAVVGLWSGTSPA